MKLRLLSFPLALLAVALGSAPGAKAQWLSHTAVTNPPLGTMQTTGAFPNPPPGYSGSVLVTASNFHDGLGNGVPGISPTAFTNVSSTFTGLYPLNPGGTFNFLSLASNDTGDTFTVTFDFSGLAGGVLPAGSLIAFTDLDSRENVDRLMAFNGGPIGNAWLSAQVGSVFNYDAAGGGISNADAASLTLAGGTYILNGEASNPTSAFQAYQTTQPISSLTFIYDHTQNVVLGGGGYGVAIEVPEPSTYALLAVGLLLGAKRFFRPSMSHAHS